MNIVDLDNYCVIKWRLTDVCNYKCSYCIRRPLVEDISNASSDFEKCYSVINHITRIATELNKINNKMIKIDLIGGEVSIFDNLSVLINKLFYCNCIAEINITTNFYRDIKYYKHLCEIASKHNKILSMTASFHCEYADLDDFMNKANIINKILGKNFKCETVITKKNTLVNEFIEKCKNINCYYMCEEDILDTTKRGQTVRNFKSDYRYLVQINGDRALYTTRNEVIKTYGKDGIAIDTRNHKCTRDRDYVYIEKNIAIPCHSRIPIANYRVSENLRECEAGQCTLCGHMSIVDIGEE